jgi:DNA-binding XRE family transcriptional regulator
VPKLTTDHPASSYGIPIFVDDLNNPLGYGEGVRLIRKAHGLTAGQFGAAIGVSRRTVEHWEQGRMPATESLLKIAHYMKTTKPPKAVRG